MDELVALLRDVQQAALASKDYVMATRINSALAKVPTKLAEVPAKEDPPAQPAENFLIVCRRCQGRDIQLDDGIRSSESGTWGDITLRCRACGNAANIVERLTRASSAKTGPQLHLSSSASAQHDREDRGRAP